MGTEQRQKERGLTMEDALWNTLLSKILALSGITIAAQQKPALEQFILQKAADKGCSPAEFCATLEAGSRDFDQLVSLITVNETYFFREEKQFDLLHDKIFPRYRGRPLTVWTCSCATGEEAISLLALGLSMGIRMNVYASDIDSEALAVLERGCYNSYSLRTDGSKYHELLVPYCTRTDSGIVFDQQFLRGIRTFRFNLQQDTEPPFGGKADIIFMRNVFIYFDRETRMRVTTKVAEHLNDGGLLFFSMNEIGSIDGTVCPQSLHKTNDGSVYYFVKGGGVQTERKDEAAAAQDAIRERLRQEAEKARGMSAQDMLREKAKEGTGAKPPAESPVNLRRTYEAVCKEINRGDFTAARTIARAVSGSDYRKYAFFLQGYTEYYADNKSAAELLFATAESLSPDFWPAFFYHGLVLRDIGKEEPARACFRKCRQLLSSFGSNNPYDFTLDSFSPSYIYEACGTLQGEDAT